uniref:Uncharacterized protein n=1 Tax=Panagrolaimus sp. JU765 TaxID=591449 RepID=A0AC34RH25_9BILA
MESNQNIQDFTQNPGSFLNLHQNCRRIQPRIFNGLKLGVGIGENSYFEILRRHISQHENLAFGALIDYQFHPNVKVRFLGTPKEVEDDPDELHIGIEGRTPDSTFGVELAGKLKTPDSTFGVELAGKLKFHYLQKCRPDLDFGFQISRNIDENAFYHLDFAAKYSTPAYVLASIFGTSGIHNSLCFRIRDDVELAVEQKLFSKNGHLASVSIQKHLPDWQANLRTTFDTRMAFHCSFERVVAPTVPLRVVFSASVESMTKTIKAGLGFVIN